MKTLMVSLSELSKAWFMNASHMRSSGSGSRRMVSSGGWSGSQYDVMSYQEAARSGQIQVRCRGNSWHHHCDLTQDTPLNKIQHKFWVTKQAVTRKLGHEEDQHVVASDCELDAKLELFRYYHHTLYWSFKGHLARKYFLVNIVSQNEKKTSQSQT